MCFKQNLLLMNFIAKKCDEVFDQKKSDEVILKNFTIYT